MAAAHRAQLTLARPGTVVEGVARAAAAAADTPRPYAAAAGGEAGDSLRPFPAPRPCAPRGAQTGSRCWAQLPSLPATRAHALPRRPLLKGATYAQVRDPFECDKRWLWGQEVGGCVLVHSSFNRQRGSYPEPGWWAKDCRREGLFSTLDSTEPHFHRVVYLNCACVTHCVVSYLEVRT